MMNRRSAQEAHPARLLIVDSGLGGLSVMKAVHAAMPEAELIYAADYAAFPYGEQPEASLQAHLVAQISKWIAEYQPSGVVIACNTASTLVLSRLRALHQGLAFVGTVPAIKPAAAFTKSGLISVLATPGTINRDYTRALLKEFAASLDVTLVASRLLADLIEKWLSGTPKEGLLRSMAQELLPCFQTRQSGAALKRTDCIVLGCTHYPLLKPLFVQLAPWPVHWIDPSHAIANRVKQLFGAGACSSHSGSIRFVTSGPPDKKAKLSHIWQRLL